MMKLSKNKKLLSFLCVIVVLCSFFGIKYISGNFIKNALAESDAVHDGDNLGEIVKTCGAKDFGDTTNEKKLLEGFFKISGEYKEISEHEVDPSIFIVSVQRGKFVSKDTVNQIIESSRDQKHGYVAYITAIKDKYGNNIDGNSQIILEPGKEIYFSLFNPDYEITYDSEWDTDENGKPIEKITYDPGTLSIKFYLYEDYNFSDSGYGCVSKSNFDKLSSMSGDEYNEELSKHPTLNGKPNGYDFGTFDADVIISVARKTSTQYYRMANPYLNTYCKAFSGEINGYLSEETINKRNFIFGKYNEFTNSAELKQNYLDNLSICNNAEISSFNTEEFVKETIENYIDSIYKSYQTTPLKGVSGEIDTWFTDAKFEEIKATGIKNPNTTYNLKCAYNTTGDFESKFNRYIYDANGNKVYNIKANSEYYFFSETKVESYTATRTYTGGVTEDISVGTCSTTCEEAVVVDYGPPIASTAGLCFEYQVQVTSKVKCSSIWNPQIPDFPLCNPVPYCNSIPGYVHQAGPDEEFESCINKCDGGKYTKKCSEKCYKDVYSKPKYKFTKQSFESNIDISATKVSDGLCSGYYTVSGGSVGWSGMFSRWYCENEYSRTLHDYNYPDSLGAIYYPSNGFKVAHYSSGNDCNDSCSYSDPCGGRGYYNQDDADNDRIKILKQIDDLEAKCNAKASCTEKTAGFTLNVSYIHDEKDKNGNKTKENQEVRFDFPYDKKSPNSDDELEKLISSADKSKCDSNPKLDDDKRHTILEYAGCYKNCGDDLTYHSRWSFPGIWFNRKSHDISYELYKNDEWKHVDKKFCLPYDAKAVNSGFYYYFNKKVNPSSLEERDLEKAIWPPSDESSIKYNINGIAKNFGHFGWNFNISCFYALPCDTITEAKGECCDKTEITNGCCNPSNRCEASPMNISFRPIDLDDVFPSNDTGADIVHRNPDDFNVYDRYLPFNWSSRGAQNNNPKEEVEFNPKVYGKFIQTNGQSIYNDDELEYHFHLTPALMRAFNSKKYKLYSTGKSTEANNSSSYVSELIRTGDLKGAAIRVPSVSVLGCNNIRYVKDGSSSGVCYTIKEMKNEYK